MISFTWLSIIEIISIGLILCHFVLPFIGSHGSRMVIYVTGYVLLAAIAYVVDLPLLLMFLDRYGPILLMVYLLSPKIRNRTDALPTPAAKFELHHVDNLVNVVMHVGLHNSYNQKATAFIFEGL